jgi:hypothetical protein
VKVPRPVQARFRPSAAGPDAYPPEVRPVLYWEGRRII